MTGPTEEQVRKLRHDLANPLAAILAEAQIQLLSVDTLPEDLQRAFREIETQARRMREILQSTKT